MVGNQTQKEKKVDKIIVGKSELCMILNTLQDDVTDKGMLNRQDMLNMVTESIEDYSDSLGEIVREREEALSKLAAMESQRFNVKEFIRRCQDQWDFDVKIASKMLEIAKHVPTVPADKSAERITEQDVREIADNVMEFNYDHKHSVDYWMREEGYYLLNKLNADREQVSAVAVYDLSPVNVEGKIRDRLIAMGWAPPGSPAVKVPDIVEAVAAFVESQTGGEFAPRVMAAAIRGQLEYGDVFKDLCTPSHSQQSAASLNEAVDVLTELMDLMQGVIEGDYKPDSFTLQPARMLMHKIKSADGYPNQQSIEE